MPGPGVLPKAEHRCCSLGRSELGHILGEHILGMLEVCGKCMGMLERLKIRMSNYRGGKKAERILEGWVVFTDFQYVDWLCKLTIDAVILKPTPFWGINRIPPFFVSA